MKKYRKFDYKIFGFRDVYWCWLLNEPVIIEYKNDKPFCKNCNWVDDNPVELKDLTRSSGLRTIPSKVFLINHTFVAHINKPS